MAITYDPKKRRATLNSRGLDFKDAQFVFDGPNFEVDDLREDYGETRIICFGVLGDRMGCGRLHAAWRGSPRVQHEEGQ